MPIIFMIAMHMCKEFYDLIQRKLQANNHEVYFVMMGEPKCCDPYKNPASSSNCARYCVGKLVSRITNHISSAKLSVCIAMYNFNNHQLADCVLRAHRRGAKVRIIIDRSSCNKKNTKSPAHRLRNAGISIRVSGEQHKLMHHKFCLIDATTANGVLITGSLNWTYGGLSKNCENVAFIYNQRVKKQYRDAFDYIWNKYTMPFGKHNNGCVGEAINNTEASNSTEAVTL